jgi:hypothetical protein
MNRKGMKTREGINWKDAISALVLLAFALLICVISYFTLPYGNYFRPGPAFLPFWSGALVGFLALLLLIKSLWRKAEKRKFFQGNPRKIFFALSVLIAYGLLFGFLGFFLCNFLLIFLFLIWERKKWYLALGSGLVSALVFYLVFSYWLNVPLPRGILEEF